MPTTLPGIFSFRAKMARIFGHKLVRSAVKRRKQQAKMRCSKSVVREERVCTHAQMVKNKCDGNDDM